jgi:excisionase family DNA binding protein
MNPLLTVAQIAELLAVSESLIYRLASEGKLRCYRLGRGALRFSESEVARYLDSCVVAVKLEPRRAPAARLKHIRI